jgi:hypothetical protein
MLHVWHIYLQNCVFFRANVGKYSSTMEHMGIKTQSMFSWHRASVGRILSKVSTTAVGFRTDIAGMLPTAMRMIWMPVTTVCFTPGRG